jgi:hypothetical protein
MSKFGPIQRWDYWFKVIEMLQQYCALIDSGVEDVVVYFFSDTSGVFDEMRFPSQEAATRELPTNGLRRISADARAPSFLRCTEPLPTADDSLTA